MFENLAIGVASGEALVLKGPNGAGKSTLLRILAGLGEPSAGRVELDGGDPERSIGEQCHYVAHADGLKPALTARENVAFWAAWLGGGDPEAALEGFGLHRLADIPAGLLSAGQKRRLGLARLLVASRPIWLLDEPTVSLDAQSAERLRALMNGHVAGGGILVAATHLPLGIDEAREVLLPGRSGPT